MAEKGSDKAGQDGHRYCLTFQLEGSIRIKQT